MRRALALMFLAIVGCHRRNVDDEFWPGWERLDQLDHVASDSSVLAQLRATYPCSDAPRGIPIVADTAIASDLRCTIAATGYRVMLAKVDSIRRASPELRLDTDSIACAHISAEAYVGRQTHKTFGEWSAAFLFPRGVVHIVIDRVTGTITIKRIPYEWDFSMAVRCSPLSHESSRRSLIRREHDAASARTVRRFTLRSDRR